MGRSRGVQQEPPSDPSVVHLLENKIQTNVWKRCQVYSLFLCKSSYPLMSLEPTPNIRRKTIPFTLFKRALWGKGYLMNAERNELGNILTSEAACLYICLEDRSVNILVIYKVPIVFFTLPIAIKMKHLNIEDKKYAGIRAFILIRSFHYPPFCFSLSSTSFFFFFSDRHPPSLLLRLYHLTCLRICQGPSSS